MSTSFRPPQGTVATRIRAFQEVPHLEKQRAEYAQSESSSSQYREQGVTVGRGRREDTSFGSPATRAARDGTDGSRGDGRPPVGTFDHKLHPSMEEKEVYRRPPLKPARPTTSLESNHDYANHSLLFKQQTSRLQRRRSRSLENLANSLPEFALARSRLRSVAEKAEPEPKELESRDRTYTLADLETMIDTAIEENVPTAITDSGNTSAEIVSQPSTVRRWKSARVSRRSIDDRGHSIVSQFPSRRQSSVPRASTNFNQAYNSDANLYKTPHMESADTRSDTIFKGRKIVYAAQQEPETRLTVPSVFPGTTSQKSPIRQRAARFEDRGHNLSGVQLNHEPPPRRHIHVKDEWSIVPEHEPSSQIEKTMHKFKFGRTLSPQPDASFKPWSLPATQKSIQKSIVNSLDKSTSSSIDTFETAHQSTDNSVQQFEDRIPVRRSSRNWPGRLNIFQKASSAPPQQTKQDIKAEAGHHHPAQISQTLVRNKVKDLLAASQPREVRLLNAHDFDDFSSTNRMTRDVRVVEADLHSHSRVPEGVTASTLPPLQLPVQEEAEYLSFATDVGSDEATKEHDIPASPKIEPVPFRGRNSPTTRKVADARHSPSTPNKLRREDPSKLPTRLPARGRSLTVGALSSPTKAMRGVEQTFTLSPSPSRSQSRASRGRMKVEVEVRDSPEREARDRGDKIVIIRADVESMHDG